MYCIECLSRTPGSAYRGLWGLLVVQLLWLSGRTLAAQARGVLGLTPSSYQSFHLLIFLPHMQCLCSWYLTCRLVCNASVTDHENIYKIKPLVQTIDYAYSNGAVNVSLISMVKHSKVHLSCGCLFSLWFWDNHLLPSTRLLMLTGQFECGPTKAPHHFSTLLNWLVSD